jgi:serine/threonine protein kinase
MIQIQPFSQLLQSLPLRADDPLIKLVQWADENGWLERERWSLLCDPGHSQWLSFRPEPANVPEQGWKLHVCADLASAETILQRLLPLLLQEAVPFKCVSSLENLEKLNAGLLGASQVGKFLTIYPAHDDEAVRLARLLDERTRGLSGPRIPSDRMLYPGSLVFYRYGGFTSKISIQELLGTVWPAIKTLENRLIPDRRGLHYAAPDQRVDPFLLSGIAVDLPQPQRILAQRYLILSPITTTMNHTISLAIDLQCQRTCIIKGSGRPWQGILPETERQHALQEASVLRELHDYPYVPDLYDMVDQEHDISLVLSDIPGQILLERLHKEHVYHLSSFQELITWGRELAEILQVIHNKGLVFTDLKPTNVIIGPDEKLYLIDFELAMRQGSRTTKPHGTRGYMSPQQFACQPRQRADDIYSFGALLYLLVTGVEPSQAPNPFALLQRPLENLRPDVPSALAEIITRCLQAQPEARYASMREVRTALDSLAGEEDHVLPLNLPVSSITIPENKAHAREMARDVLNTLCHTATSAQDDESCPWKTTHTLANGYALRDINIGLAGTVLAFAGLVAEMASPEALHILSRSVGWLRSMPPHHDPPLPGLYVGEAGVGTALLCAGQVLGAQELIEAALECGKAVAKLPHLSPDIMHGTAGRLLFHLFLWDTTGAQEQLAAALACGERLLGTAQAREPAEVCWTIPTEFGFFDADAYVGYAHGVAGIADALLDLFEATDDERFIPPIRGAAQWLQRLAIPVLADQSGLAWPAIETRHLPSLPFWCHGATGVGRFFLHACQHSWLPDAMDIARRAAQSVIHLGKSGGPSLCHGLAGNCEFLLDMYQETRQLRYLEEARAFGSLLEAFAVEREGQRVFHGDQTDTFSPDYLVGYAGIALTFLRLSDPERIPYQLSRAGVRSYARQTQATESLLKRER